MEKSLTASVEQAGIVGAGGAGFPSHVKYNAKAEYVIINGAECEPLLRVDQQLMAQEAEKLLGGLQLIVDHVGAAEGIVALKAKYHDAEDALKAQLHKYPKLRLYLLGNFYPAGDEQVVVYEVTRRIVPEGGIPLNVGVIVTNVETVLNTYDACVSQQNVTDKYITVTGAVAKPITAQVPLGITVREALELAGGVTVKDYVIVNGGPMMGKTISPEDVITKTVKGLIVLPAGHPLINSLTKGVSHMMREAKTACMHCSLCTEVCPRNLLGHRLEPHKLIRIPSYGKICDGQSSAINAFLCCECRLCEYACIQDLQPWKMNSTLKKELGKAGIKNTLHNQPEKAAAFREYKKFPVAKLVTKLGLSSYDQPAPMVALDKEFKNVFLPLRQHVGAPAESVVKEGDSVDRGQLLAKISEGKLGSNIHASISGTVTAVTAEGIRLQA
ncbi:electron transport complex protein RnfC [Aminipila butyrica]|uniref:Electron transport complex protein RnfC n=1 Tax=Aminipila butyrica TaxID=433296 RepID=A0A858BW94_9FIRM|nr:SLBB domain-containing protein [Aminipila butyrica]QIB69170.1 electron transport complex protein RnfC [Aminipila butyrica]